MYQAKIFTLQHTNFHLSTNSLEERREIVQSMKLHKEELMLKKCDKQKNNVFQLQQLPVLVVTVSSTNHHLPSLSFSCFTGSQQQEMSNGGSKVTPERVAIAILSALLAAAVIALVFTCEFPATLHPSKLTLC